MGSTLDNLERLEEVLHLEKIIRNEIGFWKLSKSDLRKFWTTWSEILKSKKVTDKQLFTLRDIKDKYLIR